VVDPHRSGHELEYYPGEITLRLADVVVINKMDTANLEDIQTLRANIKQANPYAVVVDAASPVMVEDIGLITGKRVLVVEDGPTFTHGGTTIGAGVVAAKRYGAREIINPKPYAVGSLAEVFKKYPHIGNLLPAMGYGEEQKRELAATIEQAECDTVVIGTPIDLKRVIQINKPSTRATYSLQEIGLPTMEDALAGFIKKAKG
jgi:predicted GTPase